MKSKEEIEQLADKWLAETPIKEWRGAENGYIKGYTQCQEDMTKDVEYWQGEFEHWYKQAMDMTNKYNELLNKQN